MCSPKMCKLWSFWLQFIFGLGLALLGFIPLQDWCMKSKYYMMFDGFFGCWMIICEISFAFALTLTALNAILMVQEGKCTQRITLLCSFLVLNLLFIGVLMANYVKSDVPDIMRDTIRFYSTDYEVTTIWNTMENELFCAGATSSEDWVGVRTQSKEMIIFKNVLPGCAEKINYAEARLFGACGIIVSIFLLTLIIFCRPLIDCIKYFCFCGTHSHPLNNRATQLSFEDLSGAYGSVVVEAPIPLREEPQEAQDPNMVCLKFEKEPPSTV